MLTLSVSSSRRTALALLAALALSPTALARDDEPLQVVATIPDLADVARAVGGERVDVTSLARGTENVHAVPLRPSAMVAVSRADLFLEVGLSLEHAYVPALLEAAQNPRIRPGAPGFVNCSAGWKPIQVPDQISRGDAADIHPEGNPHINLDPRAGRHFAAHVHAALVRVDPDHRAGYDARYAAYLEQLGRGEERWAELAKDLRGHAIVTYHSDFDYFARACGVEVAAVIESRPGVDPAPRSIAGTVATMKERGIDVIVTAKWSNNRHVAAVADKTDARVLELPTMVGGAPGCDTWIDMMDRLHHRLAVFLGVRQ